MITNAEILINKSELSVTSSETLPYLLEIGQSITFSLNFAPVQIQEYMDSLIIEIDSPCNFRLANSIRGIGVGKSIVFIPDVQTNLGDPEYIRIIASLNIDGEEARNISFSAKVRFKNNSIWVDDSNNLAFVDKYYDGDDVILTFENTIELLTSQELEIANIYSYSMLNETNTTPLIIEEFEWLNGVLGAETIDGVWKTNAICAESIRAVEPMDFEIISNPNPVEDISTLLIKPVSNCSATIFLYNSQGEAVVSKNIDLKEKMINEIDFELSSLSSGLYFYRIFLCGSIHTIPIIRID
jgi:hypothetical protein